MSLFVFTVFHPYFPSFYSGFKLSQATAVYRPNLVYELTPKAPQIRLTNHLSKTNLHLPKILLESIKIRL